MGHCEYVLAEDTGGNFKVLGKNKRCNGGRVSCTYAVTVKLFKPIMLTVQLLRGDVVKVDGEIKTLPYTHNTVGRGIIVVLGHLCDCLGLPSQKPQSDVKNLIRWV